MLTEEDLSFCLQVKSWMSTLKMAPLEVDLKEGTFRKEKSKWRLLLCYLLYSHFILRCGYAVIRLPLGLITGQYSTTKPHLLNWDAILVLGTIFFCFWYFVFFIQKVDVCVDLVNEAFGQGSEVSKKPGVMMYLKTHSPQELIAIWLPHAFWVAGTIIVVAISFEQEFQTSFISVIPAEYRNIWIVIGWLSEEYCFFISLMGVSTTVISTQAICLEKYLASTRYIKSCADKPRFSYASLRMLQVKVMLFNEGNAYIVFTLKLMCIGLSVLGGFGAIACFTNNPIFSACNAVISIDFLLCYGVLYQKAFAIPDGIQSIKGLVTLHINQNFGGRMFKASMKRQVQAVPAFGIRVGSFHTMERNSTPIFIDFVLRNLVGMLVLFT